MGSERTAIIISASSDIGNAMSRRWLSRGWKVFGTYRTSTAAVEELARLGAMLTYCDLADSFSVHKSCGHFQALCPAWDVLVLCPGSQDPVGPFIQCDFDEWETSVKVNFTGQMRIIRELLPFRHIDSDAAPSVLLFAGGGTNNAPLAYSAYVVAKIALTKMCELLAAELPDTRFAIVGPGWVKTKIHDSTIKAGERAGSNYQRTIQKLSSDELTPMDTVLDCCDWLLDAPLEQVSGRNFSVVYDKWGTQELAERLAEEPDMYKLRRFGNDWLVNNGGAVIHSWKPDLNNGRVGHSA